MHGVMVNGGWVQGTGGCRLGWRPPKLAQRRLFFAKRGLSWQKVAEFNPEGHGILTQGHFACTQSAGRIGRQTEKTN